MPGRRNYEAAVRQAVKLYEEKTGTDLLQYISRPGGGEPPRYEFLWKTCLGGREALNYVQTLLVALEDPSDVENHPQAGLLWVPDEEVSTGGGSAA